MKSFITSQFNYCPIIWMYCQHKSDNLINRIHERALRIAYNDYTSNFDSLLVKDDTFIFHQINVQKLCLEIYKTFHNLNAGFMNEIFILKCHNYNNRIQNLVYPNPRTVTYGLESFGYKASQLWSLIPNDIQNTNDISLFIRYISENCGNLCKCNICKLYIPNLGYVN